jgi:acetyl esterase/lipase
MTRRWGFLGLAMIMIGALLAVAPVSRVLADGDQEMEQRPIAALYSALVAERDARIRAGVAYGRLARQKLDIYEPGRADGTGPIVLFLYGGSWTSGDRAIYGFVGSAFAARGVTTVVADYRLYPHVRFPTFNEDAALAYRHVADELAVRDGRARPIILMGHSAGAHMAALLAFDRRYLDTAAPGRPRPAGLIGMAGPYAFDPTTWPDTKDIFATTASRPNAARPVAFVRPDAPPTLLLHGAADDVVTPTASRDLFAALKAAGVMAEKVEYVGVGHVGLVLTLSAPFRWRADTLSTALAFIERVGGRSAAGEREGLLPAR